MKKNKLFKILIIFILAMFANKGFCDEESSTVNISKDINNSSMISVNETSTYITYSDLSKIGYDAEGLRWRGSAYFSLSDIPSNATITSCSIIFNIGAQMGSDYGTVKVTDLPYNFSMGAWQQSWNAIWTSTNSLAESSAVDYTIKKVTLTGTGASDPLVKKLQSDLANSHVQFGVTDGKESSGYGMYLSGITLSVTYTTPTPPPTAPSIPIGLTATNVTSSSCTLSWTASSGATSYKIYYYEPNCFTPIGEPDCHNKVIVTPTNSPSIDVTGLSSNTAYNFTISAVNSYGQSAGSSPVTVTTLPLPPPSVPTNLRVTSNTTTSISLAWDVPSGTVDGYNLYNDDTMIPKLTTNSYTVNNLSVGVQYHFRVSAFNKDGVSAISSVFFVTIPTAPQIIVNHFPPGYVLMWANCTGSTGYYLYQIWPQYMFIGTLTNSTSYFAGNPSPGTYNYLVRAFNESCVSADSYAGFYVPATSSAKSMAVDTMNNSALDKSVKALSTNGNITLYPSPVKDILYVYGLTDFDATIFDLTGKKVLSVSKANESIDVSGLAPGIYIVKITGANGSLTERIVKQ